MSAIRSAADENSADPVLSADQVRLLDALSDAVIVAGVDGLIAHANPAVEPLFGWPAAELTGRPLVELMPERFRAAHRVGLERYASTGVPKLIGRPIRVPALRRDGEEREVELLLSLVPSPTSPPLLLGSLRDARDQIHLERQTSIVTHLLELLGQRRPTDELISQILSAIGTGLGCDVAALWLVEPQGRSIACAEIWHADGAITPRFDAASRQRRLVPGEGLPGRVWQEDQAVCVPDIASDPCYPRAAAAAADGLHGAFAFPLRAVTDLIGVIELLNRSPGSAPPSLMAAMAAIGSRLGQVLERALIEDERTELLDHLELERTRLASAQRLTAALVRTATIEDVVKVVEGDDLDGLGANRRELWLLSADGQLHRTVSSADPNPGEVVTVDGAAQPAITDAVGTCTPRFLVASSAPPEPSSESPTAELPASVAVVPLSVERRVLGALVLTFDDGRSFSDEEGRHLVALGEQCAQALDRAQLYDRERSARDQSDRDRQRAETLARALQTSLLPPTLPVIPGVEMEARYRAALDGIEVGGDFYDVFDTGGDWVVVLGDVCGKGAEAAAVTALVRYTVRSVAMDLRQPSGVLRRLNEVLLQESSTERFCTVVYMRLVPTAGGIRLVIARGGHPPPIIVRADGSVERIGAPGTVLGIVPDVRLWEETAVLRPGDAIVLYTDGVTEAGRGARELGEDGLAELLSSCSQLPPSELAERVEAAAIAAGGSRSHDDLAIVVMRVTG